MVWNHFMHEEILFIACHDRVVRYFYADWKRFYWSHAL